MANNQQVIPVARVTDAVKKDGVLKEQVGREDETKGVWDRRWKFLGEFHKYCVEEAEKEGLNEEEYKKLRSQKKTKQDKEVYGWKFHPSGPFPVTSFAMVGWRSAKPECRLENYDPLYESPRHTISPPSRPPTPPQNFIFLG